MQKQTLYAVLSCVWVAAFGVLIVYYFPVPREAVLKFLVAQEGVDKTSNEILGLLSSRSAAATILSGASIASVSTTTDYLPTNLYDYKFVQSVDPCTLTKLGAQGWSINQLGSNIVGVGGTDDTCQNPGNYLGFDWILFQRVHVPSGSSGN